MRSLLLSSLAMASGALFGRRYPMSEPAFFVDEPHERATSARLRRALSEYGAELAELMEGLGAAERELSAAAGGAEAALLFRRRVARVAPAWQENADALESLLSMAAFAPARSLPSPSDPPVAAPANASAREAERLYDSARQIVGHLARDWSSDGRRARRRTHGAIARALDRRLPRACRGARGGAVGCRVLVPGSGLGRLAYELASAVGATVVGRESSPTMLAACAGVLRAARRRARLTLFPHLHLPWADEVSGELRFKPVDVPDARVAPPRAARARAPALLRFELATVGAAPPARGACDAAPAASPACFDAVATSYFVDADASAAAGDVAATVRHLYATLRPDGIWVNAGPLTYHYPNAPAGARREAAAAPRPGAPLTLGELLALARGVGFVVERAPRLYSTPYSGRGARERDRMRPDEHRAAFFVCRKKAPSA